MRNFFLAAVAVFVIAGCASTEKMPSEDIEVPVLYADLIQVLKNPELPPNSREKYEAAKAINQKVDFYLTRETKTLNDIFFHGDAIIDTPNRRDRTITFNYQYGDKYIRFSFFADMNFVLRVDIKEHN